MSNTVIKVEGLSKKYRLGTVGYGSLRQDLASLWARASGKEDPNAKIGQASRLGRKGDFWALRDIGFEVHQGDRVGILGRNGAGKSTLLKLLSRVTGPTSGDIWMKGRIASLLEVGTGFHPELTGRENVYLNGAILGMKRLEIQRKFDEIVAFAGVEQFVETPVKRYSSGMYVRLAFSVAAHLESEIMIVDEVLAVGDMDFQRKCIGKMESLSVSEGKTILFVSHGLAMLESLCNKGILLKDGTRIPTEKDDIRSVIAHYSEMNQKLTDISRTDTRRASVLRFLLLNESAITCSSGIEFEAIVAIQEFCGTVDFVLTLFAEDQTRLIHQGVDLTPGVQTNPGQYRIRGKIPGNLLNIGTYQVGLTIGGDHKEQLYLDRANTLLSIRSDTSYRPWNGQQNQAVLYPEIEWNVTNES